MPGARWTDAEKQKLATLIGEGKSFAMIALDLNRPICGLEKMASQLGLYSRYQAGRYSGRAGMVLAAGKPPRRLRPCLRCCEPFPSAGAHNRLCDDCRTGTRGDSACASTVGGQRWNGERLSGA
jgi:hypothetical protein